MVASEININGTFSTLKSIIQHAITKSRLYLNQRNNNFVSLNCDGHWCKIDSNEPSRSNNKRLDTTVERNEISTETMKRFYSSFFTHRMKMEVRTGSVAIVVDEHAIKSEDGGVRETSIGWLDSFMQETRFA